jgi:hypothetical protein
MAACHNDAMNIRRLPHVLNLLLAVGLITAACGSSASPSPAGVPSPSPTAPVDAGPSVSPSAALPTPTANIVATQAAYATIETQVQEIRGLRATTAVTPVLLDEKGVRDWMAKANQDQVDHKALAAQSRMFIHLGLLPAGSSLEQLELDLTAGQVIGFYDTKSKGLYLLSASGAVGPEEQLVFSHEYTHALQDQNFGLAKLATDTVDQGDRDLARTALPEGDASLVMTKWAQANMSPLDLLSVSLGSASGAQVDQLNNAPSILRTDLLFPYNAGLSFVLGVYSQGGWTAVDKLYANPPASTSQILHSDLYTGHVAPVALTLPAGPSLGTGWARTLQDTMGELQLRVWLEGEKPDSARQTSAAAAVDKWAGDRIGLYEGPGGAWAVVLESAWRSAAGRTAFAASARQTLSGIPYPSVVCGDATHAQVVLASDLESMGQFASCKPAD